MIRFYYCWNSALLLRFLSLCCRRPIPAVDSCAKAATLHRTAAAQTQRRRREGEGSSTCPWTTSSQSTSGSSTPCVATQSPPVPPCLSLSEYLQGVGVGSLSENSPVVPPCLSLSGYTGVLQNLPKLYIFLISTFINLPS